MDSFKLSEHREYIEAACQGAEIWRNTGKTPRQLAKELGATKRELADYREAVAQHLTVRCDRTAERDKLAEECARLRAQIADLVAGGEACLDELQIHGREKHPDGELGALRMNHRRDQIATAIEQAAGTRPRIIGRPTAEQGGDHAVGVGDA